MKEYYKIPFFSEVFENLADFKVGEIFFMGNWDRGNVYMNAMIEDEKFLREHPEAEENFEQVRAFTCAIIENNRDKLRKGIKYEDLMGCKNLKFRFIKK